MHWPHEQAGNSSEPPNEQGFISRVQSKGDAYRIMAMGLAMPLPAMSGAEPCTGSASTKLSDMLALQVEACMWACEGSG